jgi:SAM-dependent MidA family methyltransferase
VNARPAPAGIPSGLPIPSDDALAASRRLSARVREELAAHGGWLPFDRFMQRALYEPGLGYYTGGSRKFGAQGDFVTAPELGPWFGECVAEQLAAWLAHLPPRITEFGAGSGALAAQVLAALARAGLDRVEYAIVELSGELRARQRDAIARAGDGLLTRVRWLDAMPDRLSGVVLGNEVLDAMPARVFRLAGARVRECGVALDLGDRQGSSSGAGGAFDEADAQAPLAWRERPADPAFAAEVGQALARAGWPAPEHWPSDYRSEIGVQASAWTRTLAERLDDGVALLVDYGFPTREFYHPQRATGTLMCHYRHRVHGDPFLLPGLQDITAHVDFGAIAAAAREADARLVGYLSQANFLINCGLIRRATEGPRGDARDHARAMQAVQTLVSEAEMGELFKAIAFARVGDDATFEAVLGASIGFARGDRSALLDAPGEASAAAATGRDAAGEASRC